MKILDIWITTALTLTSISCTHGGIYLEEVPLNIATPKALKIVRDEPNSIINRNGEMIYSWESGFLVSSKNRVVSVVPKDFPILKTETESYCEVIPTAKKAIVVSGIPGVTNEDIQFITYRRYFEAILKGRGYSISERPEDANIAILIKYGVSDPKIETKIFSTPVYDFVPSKSHTTTVTNSWGSKVGELTTTTPSSLNYAGQRTHTEQITTFKRYISMTAIDLEKFTESKKITPLWKVTTSSEGTSNDLTSTLPYLLVSSEYFIERDSRGISKGVKGLDDLRIVRLRNEVDSKRYLSLPPEKDEIKEFEDLK